MLALPVIGGPSLSISSLGSFLVFVYIWLPFMILPIQAALERVPRSLHRGLGRPRRDAAADLPQGDPAAGASGRGGRLDLHLLADPGRLHHPGHHRQLAPVHRPGGLPHQGTAGNIPLAAAFTVVPIVIMAIYLLVAKRLGAFDAL